MAAITSVNTQSRCRQYRKTAGLLDIAKQQDFSVYTSAEDLNTEDLSNDHTYANGVVTQTIYISAGVLMLIALVLSVVAIGITLRSRSHIVDLVSKAHRYIHG